MKLTLALLLALISFPVLADQTLFFMEDDLSVVAVTVADPAPPCQDTAAAAKADRDLREFQALSDDDPVPRHLDYLRKGAYCRYAILGFGFPSRWTARDIREVFLSCDDLRSFMVAHYSPA